MEAPCIVSVDKIREEDMATLEAIMNAAAQFPIIAGEPGAMSQEQRLALLHADLPLMRRGDGYSYLLKSGGMVVGYARIMAVTGVATGGDTVADVEIAFMHPDYREHEVYVRQKLAERARNVEEW